MNFFDYVSLVAAVEKKEETASGKARDGLTVECRPVLGDPQVVQRQGRVICMTRPYEACAYCPHSTFELMFNTNKERRTEQVSCPRWTSPTDRMRGKPPDGYVSVEVATCEEAPFEFCPSCPTRKNVATTGADKSIPGWYGRWKRCDVESEDDDG
jgi:hypothetical protein